MAQIIEFRAAPGRTLTAKVFLPGSDTVVQTASAVTEATNRLGTYAATFTGLTIAEYEIIGFSAGIPVARWAADVTSNNGTHPSYEPPAKYWTKTRAEYLDSVLLAETAQRSVSVTGSHHVAADVHEFQPDAITAAALATSAVNEIQTGLATLANQTTIIGYLDTEVAAIKAVTDKLSTGLVADGAVWQYTANMLELAPAGGGGAGDASQSTLLEVQDTVEAIAASLSGVPITSTGRIADGGTITLYCGDDLRVRSGTQLTIQISDVGGAIYDRLNAAGVGLAWGASRRGLPASAISGTVVSLAEVGSGAAQSLAIVIEIVDGGASLQPAEDYTWQIESEQQHSTEVDQLVEVEGSLVLRRRVV